ncbi:MAG: hypothetical protein M3R17_09770 [Bacteroidota bacterium]|nr:hypothetical protein [Bacteroidota bacterium]
MEIQTSVKINNVRDLRLQQALLQEVLELQEGELRNAVREFQHSFSISNVIKSTVSNLGKDQEFKSDALGATMNFGAQLVLDKIMNKTEKGIKGYIIHAGLKKLLSYFISKNKTAILQKITR